MKLTVAALGLQMLLVWSQFQMPLAAPRPQNDIDDYGGGLGANSGSGGFNLGPTSKTTADYNVVMGHFKDFFMYLPVMMTTLKETMTGFPKFAEGIRILASKTGRPEGGEDCNCKGNNINSNEIDNSSRYG